MEVLVVSITQSFPRFEDNQDDRTRNLVARYSRSLLMEGGPARYLGTHSLSTCVLPVITVYDVSGQQRNSHC